MARLALAAFMAACGPEDPAAPRDAATPDAAAQDAASLPEVAADATPELPGEDSGLPDAPEVPVDVAADAPDAAPACEPCSMANGCVPAPKAETCNSQDDDCDGLTDEDLCDDGSTCTTDVCGTDGDCSYNPTAGACDADGSVCTGGDACKGGVCLPGALTVCDDGNACTTDACAPLTGCAWTDAVGVACSDGNGCTQADACAKGVCVAGLAKACTASDACEVAGCDAASGACTLAKAVTGTGCDDGEACTGNDGCVDGKCLGGKAICPCVVDGDCSDDGDLCNGTVWCEPGVLQCKAKPASTVACSGGGPCAPNVCLPKTGTCAAKAAADGTACDADGSACTVADACAAGGCAKGKPLGCDDKNACTVDSCAPATGCGQTAVADKSPCAPNFWCIAGLCESNGLCGNNKIDQASEECDDGNPDAGDGCSPACTLEGAKPPKPGDLVITEIMANPAVEESSGEWFEVHNVTAHAITLTGVTIADNSGQELLTQDKLVIAAGGYFVFGSGTLAANGAADFLYAYSGSKIQFANTGDEVTLRLDKVVLDTVVFTSAKNGWKTLTSGVSYQLDVSKTDTVANDLGANWCLSKKNYGPAAEMGTPGKVNGACL